MKNAISFFIVLLCFAACSNENNNGKAKLTQPKAQERVAVFAGGCFWGIQEGFSELKGVVKATSGYTGGTKENPTYEEVSADQTGHAEAVQVIYDPSVISFSQLTHAFFVMHNPTELNRQGPDIGTSYRSMAFYSNGQEKKIIEEEIAALERTKYLGTSIVTEVKPLGKFYPAENYHQNYVKLHPNEIYVETVCGPKVDKLRAAMPDMIKDK